MESEVNARILLDSVAPHGQRLTTMEFTMPRFVLAELNTHRAFSRNTASSRAIPTHRFVEQVTQRPVVPVHWGRNRRGMQAVEELCAEESAVARQVWLEARDAAVTFAQRLAALGVHKQVTNRVLEPWMEVKVIVSATEWRNFFFLRNHRDAQPEIQALARQAQGLYDMSEQVQELDPGEWHMPLLDTLTSCDKTPVDRKAISVGRCARVSYMTHDGLVDPVADIALHDRLLKPGQTGEPQHLSPFEHVATPHADKDHRGGNFHGWIQYRQEIERVRPWA